jgi:Bacterial Ig-like domain
VKAVLTFLVLLISLGLAARLAGREQPVLVALLSWDNPVLNPPANGLTAPVDTRVAITYTETISPASVSAETFAVQGMQSGRIGGSYTVTSGTITLAPNSSFHASELVNTSLTTGIQNLRAQSPSKPTVWQFRLGVSSGGGTYTITQAANIGVIWAIEMGDLNGDHFNDVYVGAEGHDEVWLNDGTGFLSIAGKTWAACAQ